MTEEKKKEDADFVRAMYGRSDDPAVKTNAEKSPIKPIDGMSHKIKQGFYTVEVPSMAYVKRLEDIIIQQTKRAINQEKALVRLNREIAAINHHLRRQSNINRHMQNDLDRKIDGGDW